MFLAFALLSCAALAMIVHELGHLAAAKRYGVPASELGLGLGPRMIGFRLRGVAFNLRLLPVASFVRLDGTALGELAIQQQLVVHLAGVIFNLIAGMAAYGTMFGWVNLSLGLVNLLPLYKHDGWKCGVVIMRAILRRKSKPVEWAFTFSGGLASLAIVNIVFHVLRLK